MQFDSRRNSPTFQLSLQNHEDPRYTSSGTFTQEFSPWPFLNMARMLASTRLAR